MTSDVTKNLKSLSKIQIKKGEKIKKKFMDHIAKVEMDTLCEKQKNAEHDLKIKKLESSVELGALKQWIVDNLNEGGLITFFVNKKGTEELKIKVMKEKALYDIDLGTKKLGKFAIDELFSNFVVIFGVNQLEDISIREIALYYRGEIENESYGCNPMLYIKPW